MYKLIPYRRKHRKIGRNEDCPCGRTKWVEVPIPAKYFKECGTEQMKTMQEQRAVKYKHCCGHIDNQRKAMIIQRHINGFIARLFSHKKKKSKLRRLAEFFRRK